MSVVRARGCVCACARTLLYNIWKPLACGSTRFRVSVLRARTCANKVPSSMAEQVLNNEAAPRTSWRLCERQGRRTRGGRNRKSWRWRRRIRRRKGEEEKGERRRSNSKVSPASFPSLSVLPLHWCRCRMDLHQIRLHPLKCASVVCQGQSTYQHIRIIFWCFYVLC